MNEQTRTARPRKQTADGPGDHTPDEESSLLQQAAAWGGVARQAREDCEKGAEAEQELLRRRNRSGQ